MNVYEEIKEHAEAIANDGDHVVETLSPGDMWAQGDVGVVALAKMPDGVVIIEPVSQLAPGTTMGSRHRIEDLTNVKMYVRINRTELDGPIIEASAPFTIDHPEHGNVTLPAGIYGVVYQRQWTPDRTSQRVLD